jgi:hypothetical protein
LAFNLPAAPGPVNQSRAISDSDPKRANERVLQVCTGLLPARPGTAPGW